MERSEVEMATVESSPMRREGRGLTTQLHDMAFEAICRLEGNREPKDRPQLLACCESTCLLRCGEGFKEIDRSLLPSRVDLAPLIDHTILKANAWVAEVDQVCEEAGFNGFASVCVNPLWVSHCVRRLEKTPVRVCTVIGFPLGASTSYTKALEAKEAVENGVSEIDAVMPIGLLKAGDWEFVRRDCGLLRESVPNTILKLILETCLLSDEEKVMASKIAMEEGIDFIKTSTGFSSGGATEEDVRLLRKTVGTRCGVKASGGIRSYENALKMVLAGATRLGLSNSMAVVKGN